MILLYLKINIENEGEYLKKKKSKFSIEKMIHIYLDNSRYLFICLFVMKDSNDMEMNRNWTLFAMTDAMCFIHLSLFLFLERPLFLFYTTMNHEMIFTDDCLTICIDILIEKMHKKNIKKENLFIQYGQELHN